MAKSKEQKLKEQDFEKYQKVISQVFLKDISFVEQLYCFENKLSEPKRCEKCKDKFTFFKGYKHGYKEYCSVCGHSAPGVLEKRETTCNKRYGKKNVFQTSEVKEKSKKKHIENWGVDNPNKSKEFQKILKKKLTDKLGVDSYFKVPEFRKRVDEIIKNNHDGELHSRSKKVKEKTKNTNLKKYGKSSHLATEKNRECLRNKEIQGRAKETRKKTNLERFGVEFVSQLDFIKEQVKKTIFERYGLTSTYLIPGVREKTMKSMLERHGVAWGCLLNKQVNESKPEKELRIKINGEKKKLENKHFDIKIKDTNILIEVDGEYWHARDVKKINFVQLQNFLNDYKKEEIAKKNGFVLYRITVKEVKKLLKKEKITYHDIINMSYKKNYNVIYEINEIIEIEHLLYCFENKTKNEVLKYLYSFLDFCKVFLNKTFESPKDFLKQVYNINYE